MPPISSADPSVVAFSEPLAGVFHQSIATLVTLRIQIHNAATATENDIFAVTGQNINFEFLCQVKCVVIIEQ